MNLVEVTVSVVDAGDDRNSSPKDRRKFAGVTGIQNFGFRSGRQRATTGKTDRTSGIHVYAWFGDFGNRRYFRNY